MNSFDYVLRFDDEQHSLDAKQGIPLDKIVSLLHQLHKTLHLAKDETLVLSEILSNCYAVQVSTNTYKVQSQINNLHSRISHNEFLGMNDEERKYTKELGKVLSAGYYFQGYDPKESDKKIQIDKIVVPKQPEYYYQISTIYGVITSIGGRSLTGKTIIHIGDIPYDINVTHEQEMELVKLFKADRLMLTVFQKIYTETNFVKEASLEDFEVLSKKTFTQSINDLREKYPNGLLSLLTDDD